MYYFQYEKDRLARKRVREASKGVGKPRIGGPFELVDQNGRLFTSENMKGKFALVSISRPEKVDMRREWSFCLTSMHLIMALTDSNLRPDLFRVLPLSRHLSRRA